MKHSLRITLALFLALIIISGAPAALASDSEAADTMNNTAALTHTTVKTPAVDSVGGDWAVFGLARSGYDVPRSYYDGYYETVESYVRALDGVLHDYKYTEYSRVVLALTAAGFDPRSVGGYDLTLPLADFDKTIWQGINGPIFALIAFDSAGYDIPQNSDAATQATRDMYIAEILRRQLNDGGFSLDSSATVSDADITGMALQALAKYQDRADVKSAIDKALLCLSDMQRGDGGFAAWGAENSEGVIQVIIALCELGFGLDDPRFVKNGNTPLDRLIDYYIPDKGFEHIIGGGVSQMATEQALCALVSLYRFESGMDSLYDMSSVVQLPPPEGAALFPDRHADIKVLPVNEPGKSFSDIAGHRNQDSVETLAARGIIDGVGGSIFSPDGTMTRAQFAAIITRGLGLPQFNEMPFEDVAPSSWYEGYVGSAYKYGIITGKSAIRFDPDGLISKQEAAAMIVRAAKLCGIDINRGAEAARDILAQFPDYMSVSEYAFAPLAFCYDTDILSQDELLIEPTRSVTRGEIAEMLYRMLNKADLL